MEVYHLQVVSFRLTDKPTVFVVVGLVIAIVIVELTVSEDGIVRKEAFK